MTNNNFDERRASECTSFSSNLGEKIMFFMIGGTIGAAIALLFAPKRGSELRSDFANLADEGYDKALKAADRVQERTAEYYKVAKDAGTEVLDVVAAGASAVKAEISDDVDKIGAIVGDSAKRVAASAKSVNDSQ